ncbi:MAG: L-galactose dehydrogenase [Gammaproteobacteria bacterium]|jgi:L-galactose dehydrogenase
MTVNAQRDMVYTTLGRTGLKVSVAGLGCGGFSRLGQGHGASAAHSIDVVRAALDAGVNFLDTAESYRTEDIVGKALLPSERDAVVISTKTLIVKDGERRTAEQVIASLHASLKRLNTERVEVFHLHAVAPQHIDYAIEVIAPALLKERDAGRIAHLGITETAPNDFEHVVLPKAIDSGLFDVVMVAFHVLHQNARDSVFPLTQAQGVATLLMFAVRLVFSQPDRLRATLAELVASGQLPAELAAEQEPLAFMTEREGLLGIVDAAYRYARHEAGVDVVLFGTGSIEHLATNIQSILADPLPDAALAQARERFGHLVGVGLDAPNNCAKSAVSQ